MVQQLGVGLLVRQDVQEGSRCVTRSTPRVQGPCSPQCWGQAEGWRCPCVEALLVKWLKRTERGQVVKTTTTGKLMWNQCKNKWNPNFTYKNNNGNLICQHHQSTSTTTCQHSSFTQVSPVLSPPVQLWSCFVNFSQDTLIICMALSRLPIAPFTYAIYPWNV